MQIFTKSVLLLLGASLTIAAGALGPNNFARTADMNLMQFMARSMSRENPTRSMACFDYYLPVLNSISEEYQKSYGACLDASATQRCAVDNATIPDRERLQSAANSSCSLFDECNTLISSVSYFECYGSAGSENAKTMYAISANASTYLAEVREQYRLIENEEYRCTNISERAYVENTAATYEELQSCLQGKSPVPTTTTSTTSTTTTTTTTTAPPPVEDTTVDSVEPTDAPADVPQPDSRSEVQKGTKKTKKPKTN